MLVQMTILALAAAACAATKNEDQLPVVWRAQGSNCGSERGGVRLTLHGARFNRSEKLTVTVVHWPAEGTRWEHVECAVTERGEGRAVCVTGPASRPSAERHYGHPGTVVVLFDDNHWTAVPGFLFRYVPHPQIEANQTLRGNGEEGARVLVRMASPLQCVRDVTLYAVREDEQLLRYGYDQCIVHGYDAATLDCPAPVIRPYAKAFDFDYACGLSMEFAGEPTEVACDPSTVYIVRTYPSFKYFECGADDNRLYIFAPDLKRRIRAHDGVSVWFKLFGERLPCHVERLDADQLVCVPPEHVDSHGIQELMVSLNGVVNVVSYHLEFPVPS